MAYFPFFMDIKNLTCVVAGGGRTALKKIEVLLEFEAKVVVIAPDICRGIYQLQETEEGKQRITLLKRNFADDDIFHARLAVAATDEKGLNSHIADLCRKNGIPVNVVDTKEECDFVFPAIIKRKELVIAVSTGGNSPAMAMKIKQDMEAAIPDYYGDIIEILGEYRECIKNEISLPQQRIKIYNELIRLAGMQEGNLTPETIRRVIDSYKE